MRLVCVCDQLLDGTFTVTVEMESKFLADQVSDTHTRLLCVADEHSSSQVLSLFEQQYVSLVKMNFETICYV